MTGRQESVPSARAQVYCVVPEELASRLHDTLRRHFRDAGVEVIVQRRACDRRRASDRRTSAAAIEFTERRLVRNRDGRPRRRPRHHPRHHHPPTPPNTAQPSPLSLSARLTAVGVDGTGVPPSPPPVNPAPPSGSGARKEAKQHQASAAKSEEGASEVPQTDGAGDLANKPLAPTASAMKRIDVEHPYRRATVGGDHAQPSAWTRDVLYGGGLGIAALVLALGFTIVCPTPRRRAPTVPVPAWARRPRR